jgi:hypothetical protein
LDTENSIFLFAFVHAAEALFTALRAHASISHIDASWCDTVDTAGDGRSSRAVLELDGT